MGCGSSTQTVPGQSRTTNDTQLDDLDYDDNFNEPIKQKNGYSSSKEPKPSIIVTPPSASSGKSVPSTVRKASTPSSMAPVDDVIEMENLDGEDYPPKPCSLKKVEIVPDVGMFKQIDEHVSKTPKSATASVPELAQYLCKSAKTQLEKIRAIYQWVTRNIDYDVAGYLNLSGAEKKPCNPESVLRNKVSVCQGYSDLFLALCRESNVLAKTITGYSKGYSYKVGVPITTKQDTNHAWNVVYISNEWRLVDCTWDAGHVSDNMFHRHEGEFYFITDPEVFIIDHFPYVKKDMASSQKWQLLDKPCDLDSFSKAVKLQKHATNYGLVLTSHTDSTITVNKEVTVKFAANDKPLVSVGARLKDSSGSNKDQCVYVEKEGDKTYCVTVRPPSKGNFTLDIYGNQGEMNSLNSLVKYILDCKTVGDTASPFPVHFGLWGVEPNYAEYGFEDSVKTMKSFVCEKGETEIRLKVREQVSVLGNLVHAEDEKGEDKYLMIEQGPSELVIKVRMEKAGYHKLLLFAKKAGNSSYDKVMQFLVYCKTPVVPFYPYPKVYPEALKWRMFLLEPSTISLPPETEVRFRLTSSLIDTLRIGASNFERGENNTWDVIVMTPQSGEKLTVFGRSSESESKSLQGMYGFEVE